ncbi:MAG: hypothetical protein COB62_03615 [Piscirickettsiaceae bacterium]|nr:MAG: hypothetical protein COB62_03615 [Piscirickettsiaceae bacterium]
MIKAFFTTTSKIRKNKATQCIITAIEPLSVNPFPIILCNSSIIVNNGKGAYDEIIKSSSKTV